MKQRTSRVAIGVAVAMACLVGVRLALAKNEHNRAVFLFGLGNVCDHSDYVPNVPFELDVSDKDEVKWHIFNQCSSQQMVAFCSYVDDKLDKTVFEDCDSSGPNMNKPFPIDGGKKKKLTCTGKKESEPKVAVYAAPDLKECPATYDDDHTKRGPESMSLSKKTILYHAIDIEIVP